MVFTKALFAQVAMVFVLLVVAPSNANAQIYQYRCAEAVPNLYHCTDGEHANWDRYNPYSWSAEPAYTLARSLQYSAHH